VGLWILFDCTAVEEEDETVELTGETDTETADEE
jgi:hypothetical protein